jgi:tetratricopeptide (TPR) repeat protein
MNYGVALMGRGQYAEAKSYFERALALTPQYGYTHINLAIVLGALGQPVEAERQFREGLQYQPGVPSFYYFYARWLDGEGRTDEAVDHLRHAIELSPTEISSRHLLMKVYTKRQDWSALAELARATLEIQPSDPEALSSARTARAGLSGAIPPAGKERPRPGKSGDAETLLGQSLAFYQQGQYEQVLTACDQALQLRPEYPEAFNNKCTALTALGRYAEAKAACESALRLKPDFELARNNLRVAQQRIDAEALLEQSLASYQKGLYKEVIATCDRALQLWPDYAEAFNNKCTALNALGRYADAKGECENALRLKPDFELARNNLQVALRGIGR